MMRVELLDRLRMMHGKTVVNCDFSEYIRYIESTQTENAALKEQITNAKYNYLGAMADCKQYEETIAQQAEAIRLKDAALEHVVGMNLSMVTTKLCKAALATQPSPEILQARDEKVAEAFEKYKAKTIFPESVCEDDFRAGYLALLNSLELSEWVRDSDNA